MGREAARATAIARASLRSKPPRARRHHPRPIAVVGLSLLALVAVACSSDEGSETQVGARDASTTTVVQSTTTGLQTTTTTTTEASRERGRRATQYIGVEYQGNALPVPEGTEHVGGAVLGSPSATPGYGVKQFRRGTTQTLVFNRHLGERDGEPLWRVVDAIEVDLVENEEIARRECYLGSTNTPDVVAIYDKTRTREGSGDPRMGGTPKLNVATYAWMFNRSSEKALVINPSSVGCDTGLSGTGTGRPD